MELFINSNNSVKIDQNMRDWVRGEVKNALDRYKGRLTRVEVHLNDVNSSKGGVDKYCSIEARLKGLEPLAATHEALTFELALTGAAEKLETLLQRSIGRIDQKRGRTPMGGEPFANLNEPEGLPSEEGPP